MPSSPTNQAIRAVIPRVLLLGLALTAPATYAKPVGTEDGSREPLIEGPFTWAYVGQNDVESSPLLSGELSFTVREKEPLPLVEQLLGWESYRDDGSVWELVAVDEGLLDPALVDFSNEQVEQWAPGEDSEVGTTITWHPESWSTPSCGSPPVEVRLWDGESRVSVPNGAGNFRTKKTVRLERTWNDGSDTVVDKCTGTMISDNWLVTAAHCVSMVGGGVAPVSEFTVTNAYLDIVGVARVERNPAFIADLDYGDDWALIKIGSPFTTSVGHMKLYDGAKVAVPKDEDIIHLVGYPLYTYPSGACYDNSVYLDRFHLPNAIITAIPGNVLKIRGDGARGQSGASYFFCPAGAYDECEPGDQGEMVGTHAGYVDLFMNQRYRGPYVDGFRATAQSLVTSDP